MHTPAMARYLVTAIPDARLVFEPGYATFNWVDRLDELLSALVAG